MHRSPQQRPLQLDQLDLDRWYGANETRGTYQLLLIVGGQGHCLTTSASTPYQAGSVFLYAGHQPYTLSIAQRTSLYRLVFADQFVDELTTTGFYLPMPGRLDPSALELDNLRTLITMLLSERQTGAALSVTPLVDSLLRTIISLLDRLLVRHEQTSLPVAPAYLSQLTRRMVGYISQHITEPERLRLDALGHTFNYSPAHLSAIFRQQVGDSIQQFIIQHKLRRVAARLRHSPLTISEIADEFGFSDVCHLNKLFKRHYNDTPTTYRQRLLSCP